MTSSESIYAGLTPQFFNLPEKFQEFRKSQMEALEWVVYHTGKRFVGVCLPTGSGKSAWAVMLARALGVKGIIHTATRALGDQYVGMRVQGMADVRGRANYQCGQMYPGQRYQSSCEYGHQHECSLEHTPHCPYDRAVSAAVESDLVVDNYSYWLHSRKYNQSALAETERPIELMICDEATDVPDLISDFVSIRILSADEELPVALEGKYDFRGNWIPFDGQSGIMPSEPWLTWAKERRLEAQKECSRFLEHRTKAEALEDDRYEYLQELLVTCNKILSLDSNWVWQVDKDGVAFQPIWPGPLSNALWSGVPKIVLMSATLRPYTLGLLGLSKESYDFREWPATWLPQHSPFYYQPSGIKLSWRSDASDYAQIIAMADSWLDARPDRRTIIHTGSYDRARKVQAMSRHTKRMIFNESGRDAASKAEEYRRGPDNGVLVGPSYTTGFDFPGRDCEFQIILKTPYPDTTSRVMTERCKNKDYRMHVVVNKLVQIVGRPRRFDTDRSETVIFDDGIKWAMGSHQNPWHGHAPGYFKCVTLPAGRIPPAPPRMK